MPPYDPTTGMDADRRPRVTVVSRLLFGLVCFALGALAHFVYRGNRPPLRLRRSPRQSPRPSRAPRLTSTRNRSGPTATRRRHNLVRRPRHKRRRRGICGPTRIRTSRRAPGAWPAAHRRTRSSTSATAATSSTGFPMRTLQSPRSSRRDRRTEPETPSAAAPTATCRTDAGDPRTLPSRRCRSVTSCGKCRTSATGSGRRPIRANQTHPR